MNVKFLKITLNASSTADIFEYHLSQWVKHLMCNFKVVGVIQIPGPRVKICGPLSVLQRAPCISSQAVILTKFRLTISWENLRSH